MSPLVRLLITFLVIGTLIEITSLATLNYVEGNDGHLFGPTPTPTALPTPTATPTPAFGRPTKIEIPTIGMNAPMIEVGMDENGAMASPTDPHTVGWYALGTKLGWQGNAVLAAHYDDIHGNPGVFYNLKNIPVGADITITDEIGRVLTYRVERSESRPIGEWVLADIFGASDQRRLNLITCAGWWQPGIHNYSHRHIVFTRLVE